MGVEEGKKRSRYGQKSIPPNGKIDKEKRKKALGRVVKIAVGGMSRALEAGLEAGGGGRRRRERRRTRKREIAGRRARWTS